LASRIAETPPALAQHSGLPALLLRAMPAGKAVPAFDRTWLALVLTCQVWRQVITLRRYWSD